MRIYIILFISGCLSLHDCANQDGVFQPVKNDIIEYIANVKRNSNEQTYNYKQYAFRVYIKEFNSGDSKICFKGWYIMNSFDLRNQRNTHYLILENDTLLFDLPIKIEEQFVKDLGFKQFDDSLYNDISNKLFPKEHGGFTYSPASFHSCYDY